MRLSAWIKSLSMTHVSRALVRMTKFLMILNSPLSTHCIGWCSQGWRNGIETSEMNRMDMGHRLMRIIGQMRLILMDMGHRLMTYSTQLISKIISNMLVCGSPSMPKIYCSFIIAHEWIKLWNTINLNIHSQNLAQEVTRWSCSPT